LVRSATRAAATLQRCPISETPHSPHRRRRLGGSPSRRAATRAGLMTADAGAWLVAVGAAALLADLPGPGTAPHVGACAALVVVAQLAVGSAAGLYRPRWVPGSLAEAKALLASSALVATVACLLPVVSPVPSERWAAWPPALPLVAAAVAVVAMGGTRSVLRSRLEARLRPRGAPSAAVVLGAGVVGEHVVRRMLTDPACRHRPVAFLDDDPSRHGMRIAGLKVLGGREVLAEAAARTGARTLVLAMARADSALVRELTDEGESAGLRVLTVPSIDEILEGRSAPADLRDVSLEDLVGRRPVDTDLAAASDHVRGRRVLVTGAGGSIGSELCRQLATAGPAELILLDRDETALQAVQVSLAGHGLLDTREVVLADIRDAAALRAVFRSRRPEVVFHAAALKHLPLLEQYPAEAWQTNVMGTLNVLEAAQDVAVETFVTISTDKAANPTSVLGRSKRLAERLTAHAARSTGRRYLSVRFGNVLGSRGSMVPLFRDLIAADRPLTVTHPDATRFFMTIPEACHLVLQAGAIGQPGEVLVLDMGEPVRVLDIAERMIALSGRDVEVVFTGLRAGEKLHEELTGHGEVDDRPVHPLISHTAVPPLSADELDVRAVTTDLPGDHDRRVPTP
jgi:FlaA1/EpsC-like NDP-sugar epimerase